MIGRRILPRAGRAAIAHDASRSRLAPWMVASKQLGGPARLYSSGPNYDKPASRPLSRDSATNQLDPDHQSPGIPSPEDFLRKFHSAEAVELSPKPKRASKVEGIAAAESTEAVAENTGSPSKRLGDSVVRRIGVVRTGTFTERKPSPTLPPDKFKEVMRAIPHPVAVITTLHLPQFFNRSTWNPVPKEKEVERWTTPVARAMTVSSLVSLSVEPVPQVMFNITLPSITHRALKTSKRFNVHVLRNTPMAAEIAKHFSQGQVRARRIAPLALDGAPEFGLTIEPSEEDIIRQWNFYSQKTHADKKFKPFTPLNRDSVPRMMGPDIMYILQCTVRFDSVNGPSGKSGPIPGGLINLDGKNAVVIGVVESVIHAPEVQYQDTALLYGNRMFMHAQEGSKTPNTKESEPKPGENDGILARLAEEAKNMKASS